MKHMTNKQEQSALNWKEAVRFFENNLQLEQEQLEINSLFKTLSDDIQSKIKQLYANKKQGHTILDQPNKYLLNNVLNQDLSGQTLDSYRLVELIAHGGMSSVYRAQKNGIQTQKDVAIKLIPTNLQTDHTISLFKQELKTLAKLHHPNIISLHHGNVSKSGTPYLVMELIENALQIDHFFKQHKTGLSTIINHFITLCHVIDYAHKNEVIHQDIKPSNILVDEHGHLLVLDFGVAALIDATPDHHAYTLNYAAPEQKIGKQFSQPSLDTFAITSLLLKCLTQVNDSELGWQKKALDELKADTDLKMVLNKGINNQADQRYQSANEMAMDLQLWQSKLPISNFKNSPLYRLKKSIVRHPISFALAALTLIVTLVGLVFYQQQYHLAVTESKKAQQIRSILIEAIDQNDPDISKGNDLTVRDMLKQVELSHSEAPITDINNAKELFLTLASAFNKLGDYESTEANIQKVLDIEPQNTEAILELADLKTSQKEGKQADKLLSRLDKNISYAKIEHIIKYHLLRGQVHTLNNDFISANEQFLQAQKLSDQLQKPDIGVKVMAAHAISMLEQDNVDTAIEKMTQAVSSSEDILGVQHSLTLKLKAELAEIYLSFSGEKVAQATEIFEQIIPLQESLLGKNHPIVAKSLFLNSTALRSLNRMEEARSHAEQALDIAQQQFGDKHIFTGKVMMTLGIILAEDDLISAIKHAQMAVQNHEDHFGVEHSETLQYKTSYVAMLVKNNQHQEALQTLLDIHPIQTRELGPNHRATLYVEIVLSKTYVALDQLKQGIQVGERCLNNAKQSEVKNIMEVYCALTLENAYFLDQQYTAASTLIKQYQDDPLISSQPLAKKQFDDHLIFINGLTKNDL